MQEPERHQNPADPPPLIILESGSPAGPRLQARAIAAGAVIASAAMLAAPAVSVAQVASSTTTTSTDPSSTATPATATSSTTTTTTTTTTAATTTTTATPAAVAPVNTVAPTVVGTASVGETVTVDPGTWSGTPAPTFSYQWELNGVPISGATASTYKLTVADPGNQITCVVTATNDAGSDGTAATATATTPPVTATGSTTTTSGGTPSSGAGALSGGAGSGAGSVQTTHGVKHHKHKASANKAKRRRDHKRTHRKTSSKKTTTGNNSGKDNSTGLEIGSGAATKLGPSWGGNSVFNNPFTTAQLEQFAKLAGDKIQPPSYLIPIYRAAARKYKLPWQVLAAINYIETGYGRDLAISSAGALGWMQFEPATWAEYGEVITNLELNPKSKHAKAKHTVKTRAIPMSALRPLAAADEKRSLTTAQLEAVQEINAMNVAESSPKDKAMTAKQRRAAALKEAKMLKQLFGARASSVRTADGEANPWNPTDAIFAAAKMLAGDGGRKNLARAVYAYNHADWYVQEVLTVAQKINIKDSIGSATTATQPSTPGVTALTASVSKATATRGKVTVKRAKKVTTLDRLEAMRTEARLLTGIAYVWGGGHTDNDWLVTTGYDCSGFVSAVLHAGGYLTSPQTTQTLPSISDIARGPGKYVTIYDRTDAGSGDDHVIIDLGGKWWESGGGSGAGGAAMVHRITQVSKGYLQSFNLVLHPKGM